MSTRRELLIGCGSNREKKLSVRDHEGWDGLITLDNIARHHPDVLHDLEDLPLPFENDSADEIHGYEVLEHLGQQGDYVNFFAHFSEYWRILKPNGLLFATVPTSQSLWAWGDPGHRRIINEGSLVFLCQQQYDKQIGHTPMSDYRFIYKADFNTVWMKVEGDTFSFILQAIKPSRITYDL